MKKATGYVVIFAMLYGGLLLLYRFSMRSSDLTVIEGKVIGKKVQAVSSHKGSSRYGVVFEIENVDDKYGMYVGTPNYIEDSNDELGLIDTGKIYTFFVDPTALSSNGIQLGVKEIHFNGKRMFKDPNKFELVLGIFLTLLSIADLVIVSKFKRK